MPVGIDGAAVAPKHDLGSVTAEGEMKPIIKLTFVAPLAAAAALACTKVKDAPREAEAAPLAQLLLGDKVPDFSAETTQGPIRFSQWRDHQWTILLSHPRSFTPVCSTEMAVASLFEDEFTKRKTRLIALSIDTVAEQKAWLADLGQSMHTRITFPLIADADGRLARLYGMIHPNSGTSMTVRSVYIIAPDDTLRVKLDYPATTGRSFPEIIRVLDAVQFNEETKLATPANWEAGGEAVVSGSMKKPEAEATFGSRLRKVSSYLWYVRPARSL